MSAAPAVVSPGISPDLSTPTLPKTVRVEHPETISDFRFPISDLNNSAPEPFRVGRDGTLVVPASKLQQKPAPITVATSIGALDELTGGIPRGALTEICGPASSGRTSVLLSLMAQMTAAGEVCALVDASDSFDPQSAENAGVELNRVLWVRCSDVPAKNKRSSDCRLTIADWKNQNGGNRQSTIDNQKWFSVSSSRKQSQFSRVEQALKATDLLIQGGGFGLVVVDLADILPDAARRVPLTSWFRFRRAVENTATALVVVEQQPYAKTCASLVVQLSAISSQLSVNRPTRQPSHAGLFAGLEIHAEVTRDSQQRKPVRSAETQWETKTQFAM